MTDEIEKSPALESRSLGIYDARLTFRKTRQGEKVVTVKIRYSKKGRRRKEKLPFPEDINENDLYWKKRRRDDVSEYHRIDDITYKNIEHTIIPTNLGQKLEMLVLEAHKRFMKIDTEQTH